MFCVIKFGLRIILISVVQSDLNFKNDDVIRYELSAQQIAL